MDNTEFFKTNGWRWFVSEMEKELQRKLQALAGDNEDKETWKLRGDVRTLRNLIDSEKRYTGR